MTRAAPLVAASAWSHALVGPSARWTEPPPLASARPLACARKAPNRQWLKSAADAPPAALSSACDFALKEVLLTRKGAQHANVWRMLAHVEQSAKLPTELPEFAKWMELAWRKHLACLLTRNANLPLNAL